MSRSVNDSAGLYGTSASLATQRSQFRSGEVPVAVYGLGKIGLPLAAVYAEATGNTTGADIDESVVSTVNEGNAHVKREPGLDALVADVVERGALRADSDPVAVAEDAAVHVVVVPTLLTDENEPDLSAIESVVRDVGAGLSPGDLVIVESTVPPRTTTDRVVPLLADESGLELGEFGAAACPERTVSGQALADIRGTHPKVVGGVDSESTRAAALIYDELTDNELIETDDATTAEAVKVIEGVYRDVNIALANELAQYAEALDLDVNEAIDVANTQPFCEVHAPGPGVGGHCIPVYPYFLAGAFDVESPLLRCARSVNDGMADYTVSLLEAILDVRGAELAGSQILLCGLTYKANVEELRNAPATQIVQRLDEAGATVQAVDPVLDDWEAFDGVERVPIESMHDCAPDATVVVTPHEEFGAVDWDALGAPVLDGRRSIDPETVEVPVYAIGGRWP